MDRVRLGRVLGKGARLAARTAMEAVDAASAASPRPQAQPIPSVQPSAQAKPRNVTIESPRRAERVSFSSAPLRPAIRAARAGITAPLRRASRALWHELTGSFFALFAFSFLVGVWHSRASALSSLAADRHRFYGFCVLALMFGYFAVSSFVRAKRVDR